jgi:hypothetical protein
MMERGGSRTLRADGLPVAATLRREKMTMSKKDEEKFEEKTLGLKSEIRRLTVHISLLDGKVKDAERDRLRSKSETAMWQRHSIVLGAVIADKLPTLRRDE